MNVTIESFKYLGYDFDANMRTIYRKRKIETIMNTTCKDKQDKKDDDKPSPGIVLPIA